MTAVHPAASAAPSFRVIIPEGKFHGVRIDLVLYQNVMAYVLECVSTYTTPINDSTSGR